MATTTSTMTTTTATTTTTERYYDAKQLVGRTAVSRQAGRQSGRLARSLAGSLAGRLARTGRKASLQRAGAHRLRKRRGRKASRMQLGALLGHTHADIRLQILAPLLTPLPAGRARKFSSRVAWQKQKVKIITIIKPFP